jgi:hypothetical protein
MSEANAMTQQSAWGRCVRDPLFVFALGGFVLYLAYAVLRPDDSQPIQLPATTRAALIGNFETLTGRTASAADIERIEREFISDEVLFRAALEDDLHLTDSSVRGQLIEEMRYRITGMLPDPTDEQLVNHYAENLDRYRSEPAVTFRHVYFRERPADDAAILRQLRAGLPVEGESFEHGNEFPRYGRSLLRGMFGQAFIDALWDTPLDRWTGPLQSTLGWHYLRTTERLTPGLLPFDAVRQEVENDYLAALIAAAVNRYVDERLQRDEVQVAR